MWSELSGNTNVVRMCNTSRWKDRIMGVAKSELFSVSEFPTPKIAPCTEYTVICSAWQQNFIAEQAINYLQKSGKGEKTDYVHLMLPIYNERSCTENCSIHTKLNGKNSDSGINAYKRAAVEGRGYSTTLYNAGSGATITQNSVTAALCTAHKNLMFFFWDTHQQPFLHVQSCENLYHHVR